MIKQLSIILISFICSGVIIAYLFFNFTNFRIGDKIHFQSKDGTFTYMCMPSKGRDYKSLERSFENYKKEKNIQTNLKLYRTTSINYFEIGRWCEYKTLPEWQYPYLSPSSR
jgi:hypothetical protein